MNPLELFHSNALRLLHYALTEISHSIFVLFHHLLAESLRHGLRLMGDCAQTVTVAWLDGI